ncbi:MAG: hypothetical protein GY862_15805 [Gammaproteobacteria bacterium]|nr:hypothetical protein [Gammaproteobacteria bacterium]
MNEENHRRTKYGYACFVTALTVLAALLFLSAAWAGDDAGAEKEGGALTAWALPTMDAPKMLPGPVNSIAEDKNGVVWIATDNGVVRYDPSFETWRIFSSADGLLNDRVTSVHVARNGLIWFCFAWAQGVTSYDPSARIWRTISTPNNEYVCSGGIFEDASGTLWFFGWQNMLVRLESGSDVLEIRVKESFPSSVQAVLQDRRGFIWFGDWSQMTRHDPDKGRWDYFKPHQSDDNNEIKNITKIHEDIRGILWFGGDSGVGWYDPTNDEWNSVNYISGKVVEGVGTIKEDGKGRLWLGTDAGVFWHDPDSNVWREVRMDDGTGLGSIYSILVVRDNTIWFAGEGVHRYDPSSGTWKSFMDDDGLPFFKSYNWPSLWEIRGQIWVTTLDGSIVRYNADTERWEPISFLHELLLGNSADVKNGTGGQVWISTSFESTDHLSVLGNYNFDQDRGAWRFFNSGPVDIEEFEAGNVLSGTLWFSSQEFSTRNFIGYRPGHEPWRPLQDVEQFAIHEDRQGAVWIGAENGLHRCEWDTRVCRKVSFVDIEKFDVIRAIGEHDGNALWFGANKGAVRYDVRTGDTETILFDESDFKPIKALHQDRFGFLWLATESGLLRFSRKDEKWKPGKKIKNLKSVTAIREDKAGILWFLGKDHDISRYDPGTETWRTLTVENLGANSRRLSSFYVGSRVTLPDAFGAIWIATDDGIARQTWNKNGVPGRKEIFPFPGKEKWLGRISRSQKSSVALWRTRRTGLLKSTETDAETYPAETGFPVNVLESGPDGGVWAGYAMGGLVLYEADARIKVDGLPDKTILDISRVPRDKTRVWAGTNNGAALVDRNKVILSVKAGPGPVDAVLAIPDGGAWLAFNPIPSALFLTPQSPLPRQDTYLKFVAADGTINPKKFEVPRGEILDMALDADGKSVWLGTTARLYRLQDEKFVRIDAGGRLQPLPVRVLTLDPEGIVWMGIDGQSDVSATVIGYNPDSNDIRVFTPEHGLPETARIEMLDIIPDGHLAVLAGGRLVKGRVFVHQKSRHYKSRHYWFCMVLLGIGWVIGGIWGGWVRKRKAETEQRYRPLLESAQAFFTLLEHTAKRIDHRTLALPAKNMIKNNETKIRCALGDLLPVEEVQAAFASLSKQADKRSYLVFARELDPAAARQLDVYRLRENTIIMPLSAVFLRAKTAEGKGAVREALDGLHRRYLGEQDLFDMRNALDEPRFFFGRRALIDELCNALNRREHVALIGPRKAGKSSLLNLLRQRLDAFPVVMIDLQLYSRDDSTWPGRLLKHIVERYDQWGRARYGVRWTLPPASNCESGPEFRDALQARRALQRQLKNDQPLVLLLDEIERLFPRVGPEHGVREHAERFILASGILRALGLESRDRLLSLVIADRLPTFNRVNGFRLAGVDTNPFYRFFREHPLTPLNRSECTDMIREIGHAMGLAAEPKVIESVFSDSGGYPALARQLASAACQCRQAEDCLTMAHYRAGLKRLHEESGEVDTYFKENLWDTMGAAEQRVLALASAGVAGEILETRGPVPILAGESADGNRPDHLQLVEARRTLLATGVIEKCESGYRVCGALFRAWLNENLTFP